MLNTARCYGGMVTAPHHLAAQAGAAVLREGGNAIEAMVAAAATIAVVYPHMNSIGGDGFWLIETPGERPIGIQACGHVAALATPAAYAGLGHREIPPRGGIAALTTAGAVAGWAKALEIAGAWGGRIGLARLLAEAIGHARTGVAVSASQTRLTAGKLGELAGVPGFAEAYLSNGRVSQEGERLRQPALAATLEHLGRAGLDDFHRGAIAAALASDLERAGSPVRLADLQATRATLVDPLSVRVRGAELFNMPPPTQGLASLLILAVADRLGIDPADEFALVHGLVEATKQAFRVRDAHVRDPAAMDRSPADLLSPEMIASLAGAIDPARAAPWPHLGQPGDTVWMGAVDRDGRAVSYIQSIYWEFGSGVVSPATGVLWQNRGISFSLDPAHPNALRPGRLPFHTLNPALARFDDGRSLVYGTMGGDGQPQTQAAIFARHAWGGVPLQQAVTAPRWLLGRTWGSASTNLKVEPGLKAETLARLLSAGHDVEQIEPFSDTMGHAGAIVRHPDGLLEGAADPRSDGAVAGL